MLIQPNRSKISISKSKKLLKQTAIIGLKNSREIFKPKGGTVQVTMQLNSTQTEIQSSKRVTQHYNDSQKTNKHEKTS